MSVPDRRVKLDCSHEGLSLRRLDELFTRWPFLGSRWLDGSAAGRGTVGEPQAGAAADAADGDFRPGASAADDKTAAGAQEGPLSAAGPGDGAANQVWAADITYPPIKRGFLYLVAVMDWMSRRGRRGGCRTSWTRSFCIAAVEEASARFVHAGDLQQRPGMPNHRGCIQGYARRGRSAYLDGWSGAADG